MHDHLSHLQCAMALKPLLSEFSSSEVTLKVLCFSLFSAKFSNNEVKNPCELKAQLSDSQTDDYRINEDNNKTYKCK